MWRKICVLLVPAAVLLGACRGDLQTSSDPGARYGIFFPRHSLRPPDPHPTGGLKGLVTLKGGCIWIEPDHKLWMFLALWPPDSLPRKADDVLEVVDASGQVVAAVGKPVGVAGGEIADPAIIARTIGGEPPPPCRGHKAWLVTGPLR